MAVATPIQLSDVMKETETPPGKTHKPAWTNWEIRRIVIVMDLFYITLLRTTMLKPSKSVAKRSLALTSRLPAEAER